MIDKSDNLKKLLERGNIFDEIKHSVTQIEETTYSDEPDSEQTEYERIIEDIFGSD